MMFLRLQSVSLLLLTLCEELINADDLSLTRRQLDLSQFGIGGMQFAGFPGAGGQGGQVGSSFSPGYAVNGGSNGYPLPSTGEKTSGGAGLGDNSSGCKAYQLLGARGTAEGSSGSLAYNGLEQKVLSTVPGGTKEELDVSTSQDYTVGVAVEAEAAIKRISAELAKCPKTQYVLIGYSRGAMVQTQVLSSVKVPLANIAAIVLFGNPYFKAGAPQNKCDAKSGAGVAAVISPKLPDQLVDLIYDCCTTGDMICHLPAVWSLIFSTGRSLETTLQNLLSQSYMPSWLHLKPAKFWSS
ncbi:hypothetical protein PSTT_09525 [Puccinia striiformis]|uniref:Cutinase n=1 Tax=Puccinia striiformis TaxID=27350 RepID=A0A2S4V8G9_9BASI|nr:hypothetical protein PSTT_09525 [Puccinia striiformis]